MYGMHTKIVTIYSEKVNSTVYQLHNKGVCVAFLVYIMMISLFLPLLVRYCFFNVSTVYFTIEHMFHLKVFLILCNMHRSYQSVSIMYKTTFMFIC